MQPRTAPTRETAPDRLPHDALPRAPRRRPARAALLWAAATFLLSQLGLAVAIEGRWAQLRDPQYTDKVERLKCRLAEPGPRPTAVMLGSSRTVYGLRGRCAEDVLAGRGYEGAVVFNFGLPGAGPLTELLTLRRLLAEGCRPERLLIEVLPPVLAGQVRLPEIDGLAPERLRHRELALVERQIPERAGWRADWWQAWPVPCHTHRFAIMSRLAPGLLPSQVRLDWFRGADDTGWVKPPWPDVTPERYRAALERTRVEYAYYLNGFRLGGPSPPALREMLDLCREERLPATLVLMPEGSDFRGWYSAAAWGQVEGFLAELRADYGVGVVDARAWVPDEEFADSHHLTPKGAERFSERLGREVLAPQFAGRRLASQ